MCLQLPMLLASGTADEAPSQCCNPITIMLMVARSAYLEEVLFGKTDSLERYEVTSFIELAQRMTAEELVDHVEAHMAMKMFLVGNSITAADIIVALYCAQHF